MNGMNGMNALTTTTPAEQFRSKATGLLVDVANKTLHELVDEFQRLAEVIDRNVTPSEGDGFRRRLNEAGELAIREQRLVCGAARARFGISFTSYDRNMDDDIGPW